jgi:magnesium-transporting ATPase (P-type)
MELEQLKQSWDRLSEQLERNEILRKQELQMVAENRVKSYWSRIRMNQYLGWIVLICAIGILFVQNIQDDPFGWIVIGSVVVMDIFLFSPMWRIIKRLANFDANIVEQEQMILKFERLFVRNNIVEACFLAFIFAYVIIDAIIRHSAPSSEWWLWMILTIIASVILGGWRYLQEKEHIAEIKQRIMALKQFEE